GRTIGSFNVIVALHRGTSSMAMRSVCPTYVERDQERLAPPTFEAPAVARLVLLEDEVAPSFRFALPAPTTRPVASYVVSRTRTVTEGSARRFRTQSDRSLPPDRRYSVRLSSANQISISCGRPETRPSVVK